MSILRLFTAISFAVILLWTAKNKIENPKASLPQSIPLVELYKSIFSKYPFKPQPLRMEGPPHILPPQAPVRLISRMTPRARAWMQAAELKTAVRIR